VKWLIRKQLQKKISEVIVSSRMTSFWRMKVSSVRPSLWFYRSN